MALVHCPEPCLVGAGGVSWQAPGVGWFQTQVPMQCSPCKVLLPSGTLCVVGRGRPCCRRPDAAVWPWALPGGDVGGSTRVWGAEGEPTVRGRAFGDAPATPFSIQDEVETDDCCTLGAVVVADDPDGGGACAAQQPSATIHIRPGYQPAYHLLHLSQHCALRLCPQINIRTASRVLIPKQIIHGLHATHHAVCRGPNVGVLCKP